MRQLTRNEQVFGSIPKGGSKYKALTAFAVSVFSLCHHYVTTRINSITIQSVLLSSWHQNILSTSSNPTHDVDGSYLKKKGDCFG